MLVRKKLKMTPIYSQSNLPLDQSKITNASTMLNHILKTMHTQSGEYGNTDHCCIIIRLALRKCLIFRALDSCFNEYVIY